MKVSKRVPGKTKVKGKRWRKGHSSDSNPETNRHRVAAKNRFFQFEKQGDSLLTEKALAAHNEIEIDKDGDTLLEDVQSDQESYVSRWTNCTNTTFARLDRYANSSSALHKEVLAVLAAVTEVIKSKDGVENETEYFAILMTTMETVADDDSLAAVAYLLNMVVRRVPHAVLKARFSDIGSKLADVLGNHVDTDMPVLLKSILGCLATVLRVQDAGTWQHASTNQIYTALLTFSVHPKPKVRKTCQEAVASILKGSTFLSQPKQPKLHPAAAITAKFCVSQMEKCGGIGEALGTLHSLELLDKVITCFPRSSLKSVCETILKAMTLTNPVVLSVCMKVLHNLFSRKASDETLSAQLNAQLIVALYDYRPRETDVQPMAAWLATSKAAHCNLVRLDENLCLSHLPKFVSTCMMCMQLDKSEIVSAATGALQGLIEECLGSQLESIEESLKSVSEDSSHPVLAILRSLEAGLSYQYHASWGSVLKVLGAFFKILAVPCYPFMKKTLHSMVELRDSFHFNFKGELDFAVGMAIKSLGPKRLLKALPIEIVAPGSNSDFPHSWLLPVLRDNIENTELAFFASYFLPLAAKLRTMAETCQQGGRMVEAKVFNTLQEQIWSLLPSFCKQPTDIPQSFKGLAKILGTALNERPDLRMMILSSLRKLIVHNMESEENRKHLAMFAKNYLPILFNLYTNERGEVGDMTHQAVLETIKTYLSVTDSQLISTFFQTSLTKLKETGTTGIRLYALYDITVAMIPYLDSQQLFELFQFATPHLQNKEDRTMQKKAYRALEEMCASKSEDSQKFVTKHLEPLKTMLAESLSVSNPSSKAPRIRCLIHIFQKLDEEEMDFLTTIIPEAILCTREVNEKARTAAYKLLVEMANAFIKWHKDLSRQDALGQFFELMLAGLAGEPVMVAATTQGLAHALFYFRDDVNPQALSGFVEGLSFLLQAKSREVVQAGLGLLKVLLTIFPDTSLAQYLPKVISSLVAMKEAHHFRFKAKEIFTRLIRKFGYLMVHQMTPESLHKMLVNIRKTTERAKKKKKAAEEEEGDEDEDEDQPMKSQPERIEDLLGDSDSELEDDAKDKKSRKKTDASRKKAVGVWLKEEQEDIVDFLDKSVSKKVLGTKPDKEGKKSVKHDFKKAPDGRFIITNGEDEENEGKNPSRKRQKSSGPAEDDDLEDLFEALGGGPAVKRKRKFSESGLEDDDEETSMKYKAGGAGIHRNLEGEKAPGEEYKAKKAKGDMKKKGRPDPYAYVPLDKKFLNKRKKHKAAGQFKSLIVGAQKGAIKGKKMRAKRK